MSDLITQLDALGLHDLLAQDEDFREEDASILKAEEDDDNDLLLLTIADELKICFNFLDDSDLIVMTLALGNLEATGHDMSTVNDFNTDAVYTALFVDDEGDLVLRSTLCLRGGVSEDAIFEFISNFTDELDDFTSMFYDEDDEEGDEEDDEDIE